MMQPRWGKELKGGEKALNLKLIFRALLINQPYQEKEVIIFPARIIQICATGRGQVNI